MRTYLFLLIAGTTCALTFSPANAHDNKGLQVSGNGAQTTASASSHAPLGVMGEHMHKAGEWMLSYRFMHMDMGGSRKGTNNIDPVTIATTESNRFFGVAGQPSTLRVVPTEMTMDMHMLGTMYAPTDWLTLMAMANYLEKDMKHLTFAGGAGANVLGTFSTESEGWGDIKVSGLVRLYEDKINHVHLNAGLSLPTGSIDGSATVLAPNGMTPRLRMPYAMQLGTGTYDLLPGITYTGRDEKWGWGAQYTAQIPLESENSEGYRWGDKHSLSVWGSYEWAQWISTSARLTGTSQDKIHGIDSNIVAPVQSADPDHYGGRMLDLGLGVNLIGVKGPLTDHRLAIEATAPLYRDLNGPQLEKDWTLTIGWQRSF